MDDIQLEEQFTSIRVPDVIDLQWAQSFHEKLKAAIHEQRALEVPFLLVQCCNTMRAHTLQASIRGAEALAHGGPKTKCTCMQEVLSEDAAACILARVAVILDKESTVLDVCSHPILICACTCNTLSV